MSTIQELFQKMNIPLYQNESLDLDHYYQEPYQDNEESNETYQMSDPFETDKTKKKHRLFYEPTGESLFAFFMDGSRRTYKIGDIVPEKGKIFPVVVAQVRAGCTERKTDKKVHKHKLEAKNLLLLSSRLNDADFSDLKFRIERTETAKAINLELVQYKYDPQKDLVPTNAAIAKANSIMHEMEINILTEMVKSKSLDTDRMLIVDGPLQFMIHPPKVFFGLQISILSIFSGKMTIREGRSEFAIIPNVFSLIL